MGRTRLARAPPRRRHGQVQPKGPPRRQRGPGFRRGGRGPPSNLFQLCQSLHKLPIKQMRRLPNVLRRRRNHPRKRDRQPRELQAAGAAEALRVVPDERLPGVPSYGAVPRTSQAAPPPRPQADATDQAAQGGHPQGPGHRVVGRGPVDGVDAKRFCTRPQARATAARLGRTLLKGVLPPGAGRPDHGLLYMKHTPTPSMHLHTRTSSIIGSFPIQPPRSHSDQYTRRQKANRMRTLAVKPLLPHISRARAP
mmetsp:Transcript_8492/g.27961  ORF Transcript_8492/g.27961 Transcript_8492/m.27961 type:complete len:252 (+) Transcript_8492:535-1290(+)